MENSQRATVVKALIISNKTLKGRKNIYCNFSDGKKGLYLGCYNSSLTKKRIAPDQLTGKTWPEVKQIIQFLQKDISKNLKSNRENYWN